MDLYIYILVFAIVFLVVLQGMQKARTKRNETGEIDSWYYFQEFEALSRICKG